MTYQIAPFGNEQFLTSNGALAVGYQLFTYLAGTSTKEAVAAAFDGLSFHTNPIILNANGLPPSPLYIDIEKAYKFVYASPTDTDPPSSPIYTADNITVKNLNAQSSDWVAGTTPTYIGATQFSVDGDQRTLYQVGRRVKLVASGSTVYGTISVSAFTTVTTVTALIDDGLVISASLNSVFYGLLSAAGSSWPGGFSTGLLTTFDGNVVIRTSTPSVRLIGLEASALDYLIQENGGTLQTYLNTGTETAPTWTLDNALAMPGDIKEAAYAATPSGWLPCDGASLLRTTYARLFAAIGTQFGSVDGTHFNVPDRRGRMAIMVDGAANRVTAASTNGANADTLGGAGGAETHTLVDAEIPTLNIRQALTLGGVTDAIAVGGGVTDAATVTTLQDAANFSGGGGAHSNTPPWIAMNFFIKY